METTHKGNNGQARSGGPDPLPSPRPALVVPACSWELGGVSGPPRVPEAVYGPLSDEELAEAARFLRDELDVELHWSLVLDSGPRSWADALLSANGRLHRMEEAKRVKFWRQRAAKVGAAVPPLPWGRVVMSFRVPRNLRREASNLQPMAKAIMDGLVDAGVFPDDRDEHVVGPDARREWANGPYQVAVRIYRRRGLDIGARRA